MLYLSTIEDTGNCPKYQNKDRSFHLCLNFYCFLTPFLCLSRLRGCLLKLAYSSFLRRISIGIRQDEEDPAVARLMNQTWEQIIVADHQTLSGWRRMTHLATPWAEVIFPDFNSGDALYHDHHRGCTWAKTQRLFSLGPIWLLNCTYLQLASSKIACLSEETIPSDHHNPTVRYLPVETALNDAQTNNNRLVYAKRLARDRLAHTIARFRFGLSNIRALRC